MPVSLGVQKDHGFDDPLGLLFDCHRRIELFLNMLLKVATDLRGGKLDTQHRDALEAALRYFSTAMPRHTADEEESLFPRLRQMNSPQAGEALKRIEVLKADHIAADRDHQRVDLLGRKWVAEGQLSQPALDELMTLLNRLQEMYSRHIQVEDTSLFPAARQLLSEDQVREIGREMAERRGLKPVHQL